jgi:hypothetical protein
VFRDIFIRTTDPALLVSGFPETSVVDPDPNVFGAPGSVSVILCTDPDPDASITKQIK